jgi:hypothetical protein
VSIAYLARRVVTFFGTILIGFGSAGSGFAASTEDRISVPFVGCPSDGQQGPVAAPTSVRHMPIVPPSAAGRLAYYASDYIGVLAPRGWHCFSTSGSGGDTIFVTPEPHDARDLFSPKTKFVGPAVELQRIWGGAFGRLEVAQVAARIFPIAKPIVQQVIAEGLVPKTMFPSTPFPNDVLNRRNDTEVKYVTAANSEGLGTYSLLAKNDQPITGLAILQPTKDMSLVLLSVRLPPRLREISSVIAETVERDKSDN